MSRLFITGDTHNSLEINRLSKKNFPLSKSLTKEDIVLVAGDFGFPWDGSKEDKYWLDWLEDAPFSLAFCDGNHVNHPMLAEYPQEQWNGGQTHTLRPHIHHLMRGEIFNICGHSWFAFGGAKSIDKAYRKEGTSWWPQEIASYDEMENGVINLQNANDKVDFIITHCAPNYIIDKLMPYDKPYDDMTNYLEKWVRRYTEFNKWFMGHYHIDRSYDNQKYNILYKDIIELLPNGEIKVVNN